MFFIIFIFVVLSLGTWQVFRLDLKNNLIFNLENNLKKNFVSFNIDIDQEYTKVLLKKKDLKSKIFLLADVEAKYHFLNGI